MKTLTLLMLVFSSLTYSYDQSLSHIHASLPLQGKVKPSSRAKRGGPDPKGTIRLVNVLDFYYTAKIEVGTPAQTISVLLDTTSGPTWLLSSSMCANKKTLCRNHRMYKSVDSNSYKPSQRTYSMNPAPQTLIKGTFGKDNVRIGGKKIKRQQFVEATEVDRHTVLQNYDGVFGLGLTVEGAASPDIVPPIANLVEQCQLKEAVFAFYFSKPTEVIDTSVLTLGGVDDTKYTGPFITVPLSSKAKWIVTIDRITFNTHQIGINIPALINPGVSGIYGPPKIINLVYKSIGATLDEKDGLYYIPCSTKTVLPDFTIEFGNNVLTMNSSQYVVQYNDIEFGMTCWSGFAADKSLDTLVLGVTFMQVYYTKFDYEHKEISFALAA